MANGPPSGEAEAFTSVATLYFGEGDSSEFIAYRFDTARQTPGQTLVLDGAGEAFLVVDSWSSDRITAVWYGKTFGRLGTVVLQRDLVPDLRSRSRIDAIGGLYQTDQWDFELSAAASVSEERTDFYPLHLYGWAKEKIAHARRRVIEDGVYDYRTGALVLRLDDGRTVLGRAVRKDDGRSGLSLYWATSPRSGTPLVTGQETFFWRAGDSAADGTRQARSAAP